MSNDGQTEKSGFPAVARSFPPSRNFQVFRVLVYLVCLSPSRERASGLLEAPVTECECISSLRYNEDDREQESAEE